MIVKQRDATKSRIAFLENYDTPSMDSIQRQGLKQAAARLRADCTSENACVQIDNYFSESDDWLIIHDLRMRHVKQILQINHLLISNSLEFYIIDSRYLNNGLKLNENGQCWALINNHSTPIASPLNKLNRDIRILREIIKKTKNLPQFMGVSRPYSVQGYILTAPTLNALKPPSSALDSSAVIAVDTLFSLLWEKRQSWMQSKVRNVDLIALQNFAQSLLSLHIPTVSDKLMDADLTHNKHPTAQEQDTSHCAQCSKPVLASVREQSFRSMEICQGQVLCINCQVAAQNRAKLNIA